MAETDRIGTLAGASVEAVLRALASRSPTPGGGAAAALAAAAGLASGAMAARYTTGPKWPQASERAEVLAAKLDALREECMRLADADVKAYGAVSGARSTKDAAAITRAEAAASKVPADLIARCAAGGKLLAEFMPNCNPQIVSDVHVAIHLLIGAARASWHTLIANRPDDELRNAAATQVASLRDIELKVTDLNVV